MSTPAIYKWYRIKLKVGRLNPFRKRRKPMLPFPNWTEFYAGRTAEEIQLDAWR